MPQINPAPAANALTDRMLVRELVENWVLYRDAGDWERFRTVWHADGRMMATWCQADVDGFIQASRQGWAKGVNILHFLGGSSIEVVADRALAQTKMTISQRADVEGVLVDVVCTGRFYDFTERRDGVWGIVRRQPIYEKDRMDVVSPAQAVGLDTARLEAFPPGYRHLAYLQREQGFDVKDGLPGLTGPVVENLYAEGAAWLGGSATPGVPL